jgi:hypothetical protein
VGLGELTGFGVVRLAGTTDVTEVRAEVGGRAPRGRAGRRAGDRP